MEYMNMPGFLGTRAPFFMDVVTTIVAVLPLLVGGAIYLAKNKQYKYHALAQRVIFIVSVIVLTYFETGARFAGGFDAFMQGSSVSHNYAFLVLIIHIAIAIATLIIWIFNLVMIKKLLQTNKHKKIGKMVFLGVLATSVTGIWVYALLFIY
jgi:putative membrane protein